MGHFIELPKLVHPDFAVPNRKPVGAVEVDHQDKIPPPDHLYGFSNAGRLLDLAGGHHSNAFAGNTSIQRNRIRFDGTNNTQVSFPDTPEHPGDSSIFCSKTALTISAIINITGGTSPGIIGDYAGGLVSAMVFLSSLGYVYFRTRCDAVQKTINGTTNVVDGRDHHIIAQYDGANMYLLVDGVQVATTTQTGTTTGGYTKRLGIGSYAGVHTGNVPIGEIDHVAIWFSAPDRGAIAKNPYGYLKPSNPITYFIPSAGGGAFTLACNSGTYSLSGAAAALTTSRRLAANSGAYSVAGTNAGLRADRALAANSGSYSLSGTSAALRAARKLTADSGTYSISGTNVTLTYNPVSGNYTLVAESGSYALTGTNASLIKDSVLPAASGSYSLSGTAAALNRGFILVADSGAYTLSGTAVSFVASRVLSAESGAYLITGTSVSFSYSGAILNEPSLFFNAPMGESLYFNAPLGSDIYFNSKLH